MGRSAQLERQADLRGGEMHDNPRATEKEQELPAGEADDEAAWDEEDEEEDEDE